MKFIASFALSGVLMLAACSHHKDEKRSESMETASYSTSVTQEGLDKTVESWPESSRSAIQSLTSKYGLPTSVTDEMVVWNNTSPFKRSVVYKEEINHQFPIQHSDVLMQTLDYRVPLDKVSELSRFDGSLIIDRTKGELSSRNDREELNILAFNLADKIVRGEMTVEKARREYSKNAEAFSAGTTNAMLTGLNFQTEGSTSDPDSMMQSQESKEDSSIKRTFQSETVEEVMED